VSLFLCLPKSSYDAATAFHFGIDYLMYAMTH